MISYYLLASWFASTVYGECTNSTLTFMNDELINADCWYDVSQNGGSYYTQPVSNGANSGSIVFAVDPFSNHRPKLAAINKYGVGTFDWRVFIPTFQVGDITGVGAVLYHDDLHEIEFFCGMGNAATRASKGITGMPSKMLCFMNSLSVDGLTQNTSSDVVVVDVERWYDLQITLIESNGRIIAIWRINNELKKTLILDWGTAAVPDGFNVVMGLENLPYMGDYTYTTFPTGKRNQNYAVFDSFRYSNGTLGNTNGFIDQFANYKAWMDDSTNGGRYYTLNSSRGATGGVVKFEVDAYSKNRVKLRHIQGKTLGTYEWRVYIPTFQPKDITSVGSFLYFDDYHEVDFECGVGPKDIRTNLGITNQPFKMICFLTSQSVDGKSWDTRTSDTFVIDGEKWYTFKMLVTEENNTIIVTWYINGEMKKRVEHKWGSKDIPGGFYAYMSLENLTFMGDFGYDGFPSTGGHVNEAVFDYVSFSPADGN